MAVRLLLLEHVPHGNQQPPGGPTRLSGENPTPKRTHPFEGVANTSEVFDANIQGITLLIILILRAIGRSGGTGFKGQFINMPMI